MPADRLFDDAPRSDASRARAQESPFQFLNRVSRAEEAAPRAILDAWFAHWPVDDRDDLDARFRAKDERQFYGAFWELYMHEAHRRLGFAATRDPEMPDSSHRPDFLMSNGTESFYLEATVIHHSTDELARRRRQRIVVEMINDARHADFFVMIKAIGAGERQPARAAVVRAVEAWLRTVDWETERARMHDFHRPPDHIEVSRWQLFLRPWPKDPAGRGESTITVISTPSSVGIANEPQMILDDLRDKASR
jgi:hypothetical protein